ncbi:zinc-ribbon domain-containing protein [Thermosyntropha lipolytica DSM 11003]|uniref:Zinc-ribbon domain-containing protein n=1 Tax=Thermosyntropha lipolytica DSM 11003 TaxID=1123382 RepID=A0A1M5K3H6_9FIRM|nr:zinc ribbon domain-containing protein [Thermosyntropha lipolytica]SHG47314.1 zinc-ribbon domain-containing protein [Thermosyntropha lipolytica DSM 11003]
MEKSTRLSLRPEWLAYLLDKTGKKQSLLAPAISKRAGGLTREEINQLQKEEILDDKGNLTSKTRDIFACLARPRAVVRLRLTDGQGFGENNLYLGDKDEWILLTNRGEDLFLKYPVTPYMALQEVRELLGESFFSSIMWEENLSLEESVFLAALIDGARKKMLLAMAADSLETDIYLTQQDLFRWAADPGSNAQWLTVIIKGIIPEHLDLKLEKALISLEKKGFIKIDGSQVNLAPVTSFLASRLLVIDKVFSLRAVYQTGEGITQIGFVTVQGGVNDVLMLECDGQYVHWQGISPSDLLAMTKTIISNLQEIAQLLPEDADKPYCPSCQLEVLPEARFCSFCGTPLKTEGS